MGEVCIDEGDLAAAEHHLEIALETTRRARNVLAECSARTRVAMLRLAQGRYADALVAADECLALAERMWICGLSRVGAPRSWEGTVPSRPA